MKDKVYYLLHCYHVKMNEPYLLFEKEKVGSFIFKKVAHSFQLIAFRFLLRVDCFAADVE